MSFEERLRDRICESRRAPWARGLAHWAERYLNAWHNTGFYDFSRNGEAFVLSVFARRMVDSEPIVWDVGAHAGEYAREVHTMLPSAKVVSFEILPPTAEKLKKRNFDRAWFRLLEMGLSNRTGSVEVTWNKLYSTTSAIQPTTEFFRHDEIERVTCPVSTVDDLVAGGEPPPQFLKIDVEGHDPAVLMGAQTLLASNQAPVLIQFEYGQTWIPSSATLCATQAMLESFGYSVGRLYRDHVGFKAYEYRDESFRMGNVIATNDPALKAALS
jgi:FkbM family methyltransferase